MTFTAILNAVNILATDYSCRQKIGIQMQKMIDGLGIYRLTDQFFIVLQQKEGINVDNKLKQTADTIHGTIFLRACLVSF